MRASSGAENKHLRNVHPEMYSVIALKLKALKQVALLLETHMVFSSGAEPAAADEEAADQEVSPPVAN